MACPTGYRLKQGDLFAPLGGERYDLILTNPPYVDAEALAAFPPEYAAEPRMAHAGGADGLDIVRRILSEAPDHLTTDGRLVCEIGRGQDRLVSDYPRSAFRLARHRGKLRRSVPAAGGGLFTAEAPAGPDAVGDERLIAALLPV